MRLLTSGVHPCSCTNCSQGPSSTKSECGVLKNHSKRYHHFPLKMCTSDVIFGGRGPPRTCCRERHYIARSTQARCKTIQQSNKLTFHRRFFAFLLPWLRRCCLHATFATYFFSSGKIMAVRYGDGGRGCVCWHPLICLEEKRWFRICRTTEFFDQFFVVGCQLVVVVESFVL